MRNWTSKGAASVIIIFAAITLSSIFILKTFYAKVKEEVRHDIPATHIAVSPENPEILYLTTDGSGILKSSDGGKRWTPVNKGLRIRRILFLAISPFHSNILYIGTQGGGIYKSEDGGEGWVGTYEGLTNMTVNGLVFDPSDPDLLYLMTMHGGVFRSIDQGKVWTFFGEGLTSLDKYPLHTLLLIPSNPPVLYLGREDGLYRRGVHDRAWVKVKELDGMPVQALAYDPLKGIIYAGAGHNGQLFMSHDKGVTWSPVGKELGLPIDVLIVNQASSILYASLFTRGVYRSMDQGASWDEVNRGLPAADVKAITLDPKDPNILYAGLWGGGIYKSTHRGETWVSLGKGVPAGTEAFPVLTNMTPPLYAKVDVPKPMPFFKCNICHGWIDPMLNSMGEESWHVIGTPREWGYTVKRMNAIYQLVGEESRWAELTPEEEVIVTRFLNSYLGPRTK